ncbi:MAG: hypothetical protein QOE77_2760 [Blastocatellia bacterium]|jgi:hypothetical protein|nr:hypothetical protein [Blastocatellia bacterium]
MLLKFLSMAGKFRFRAIVGCAFLVCVLAPDSNAQGTPRAFPNSIPRVGTIKDYPATGLMTGCGNLFVYPVSPADSSPPEAYVFLSRGDGGNAWMNLGGRDVRLRKVKAPANHKRHADSYYYRVGALRISVLLEPFTPKDGVASDSDMTFKMKITLRKRSAVRVVRATGSSDC